MENRAHAIVAGLFTVLLVIAAILVALWLNRDRVQRVPYELATTRSVPGLNPQAAVRYRGLDVGKVDDISFDPKVTGQILVHISVRPDTPITKSTYGALGYQGVTGIAYVQLDDDGSNPARLPSSAAHVARIAMRPSLLDTLQDKGLAILQQTEAITERINTLLTPQNEKTILGAFDNISRTAYAFGRIPDALEPTLQKLPQLTRDAQKTLASLDSLSRNVNQLTSALQVAGGPIDRLTQSADRIGAAANTVQLQILPLTNDVRSSLRSINRTLDGLNDRPQSILFGAPRNAPGPGEEGFVPPQP